MGYMYAAIFGIAGLILIFQLSKENKIFYKFDENITSKD